MVVIRDMLQNVEREQQTHLQQLANMEEQTRSATFPAIFNSLILSLYIFHLFFTSDPVGLLLPLFLTSKSVCTLSALFLPISFTVTLL